MKINGWIILGLLVSVIASSRSLASEEWIEEIGLVEQALSSLSRVPASTSTSQQSTWKELNEFQTRLWRAMALDPAYRALVPVSQVPRELFSAELTADLQERFSALKRSSIPQNAQAQSEFDRYASTVASILSLRAVRRFPESRASAKRGTLGQHFEELNSRLTQSPQVKSYPISVSQHEIQTLIKRMQTIKAGAKNAVQASNKHNIFQNGTQFVWIMMIAIAGFFLGLAGSRFSPENIQETLRKGLKQIKQAPQVLAQVHQSSAPQEEKQFSETPPGTTTHTQSLDYARWLMELEEILTRLKSSQVTHERRIEEIVHNSGKMSQFALSLYADARIKNEANLEFRMSSLLREIQQQYEQGQHLQSGGRVQFNSILEHCLKLCDAVETNSVERKAATPEKQKGKSARVPNTAQSA